ncbi:MAG: SRPBCC domain-containing protein, partial [Bacteroidota bacterium]
MNGNLLFNFKVEKSTSTVFVDKEFDAGLSLVWDAFTKAEILDQWWAPKPFISKTKYMDFSVGGRRFYAMVSPDGAEIGWQIFDYTSITPKSNFKCLSVFTDKDETPLLPAANWDLTFNEQNARPPARSDHSGGDDPVGREITKVSISICFESLEELEKMIQMGFKEGFTATLNELST